MKSKELIAHIKQLAGSSCFYECDQAMLRIEYSCDDDHFDCIDEDSGEMYQIHFEEVDELRDKFHKLVSEGVLENLRWE
jgi:hypothetical protein